MALLLPCLTSVLTVSSFAIAVTVSASRSVDAIMMVRACMVLVIPICATPRTRQCLATE
jgi:hypothetical protein